MLFKDWISAELKEVGKTWNDLTKADIGGQTMWNIQNGKYRTLKEGTLQKIALVLHLCIGDVRDAIAQSIKEEDAVEPEATEQVETVEPEELPFGELDTEDEENDMKLYQDKLKDDEPAPEKVKVKKEAVKEINIIHVGEDVVQAAEKTKAKLEAASKQAIMTTKEAMKKMGLETSDDPVNHPAHYTQGGIECIAAIEASMTPEEFRGYLKGCQMKYMWRYQLKGGVEDLRKARWYLDRLIKKVEADD